MNFLSKEEMIEFLRNNLKIKLVKIGETLEVQLWIDKEILDWDTVTIER